MVGIEIERKFLVINHDWRPRQGVVFRQGYLNRDRGRTVRVRLAGDRGYLTIKGAAQGLVRAEFEYEIPGQDAQQLLGLCEGPLIEKTRYRVSHEGHVWEVDEFAGENQGLVVAELELDSPDEPFVRPPWVGREVSDDHRYSNSQLSLRPYKVWRDEA